MYHHILLRIYTASEIFMPMILPMLEFTIRRLINRRASSKLLAETFRSSFLLISKKAFLIRKGAFVLIRTKHLNKTL